MDRIAFRTWFAFGLVASLASLPVLAEEQHSQNHPGPRLLLDQARALWQDTLGARGSLPAASRPASTVTPPGYYSLSIDGPLEVGGAVFQSGRVFIHQDGGSDHMNTALGADALISLTTGYPDPGNGAQNTAVGYGALRETTSGYGNTAVGTRALAANTEGFDNTAIGSYALSLNTAGKFNVAVGAYSLLFNTTGYSNSATGHSALASTSTGTLNTGHGAFALSFNTAGSRNTGLGYQAGLFNSTGSDNIWIANYGSEESNTLRIGQGTGTGSFEQNRTFISGIRGIATGQADALTVLVDSNGQLGTVSSSRRFKEDIHEMGNASAGLEKLRPVTFRYKKAFHNGETPIRYGLIAEEVADVFPDLVAYDEAGEPNAVLDHMLVPMLVNELQRAQGEIAALKAGQEDRWAAQERRIAELEAKLDRIDHDASKR